MVEIDHAEEDGRFHRFSVRDNGPRISPRYQERIGVMFQTLQPRDRERDPLRHLPVVLLTISDDERDRIEAYHLNVAGYIPKPVTFFDFVEAMATLNEYGTRVELP